MKKLLFTSLILIWFSFTAKTQNQIPISSVSTSSTMRGNSNCLYDGVITGSDSQWYSTVGSVDESLIITLSNYLPISKLELYNNNLALYRTNINVYLSNTENVFGAVPDVVYSAPNITGKVDIPINSSVSSKFIKIVFKGSSTSYSPIALSEISVFTSSQLFQNGSFSKLNVYDDASFSKNINIVGNSLSINKNYGNANLILSSSYSTGNTVQASILFNTYKDYMPNTYNKAGIIAHKPTSEPRGTLDLHFVSNISQSSLNATISDTRLFISGTTGYLGIGTTNPQSLLAVNGRITTKELNVTLTGWSDFVFAPTYKLPTLSEVEQYIKENKHLKDIPSATEVLQNGAELGTMNAKLLQKIEELTLYLIEQNKCILSQKDKINQLEQRLDAICK